tara:strand:+ start:70 stop:333 length:264 start_codon:yes stop_codon:yes gene_type:complete
MVFDWVGSLFHKALDNKANVTPNASWSSLSTLDEQDVEQDVDEQDETCEKDTNDMHTYRIPGSNSCLIDYEQTSKKPFILRSTSFPL